MQSFSTCIKSNIIGFFWDTQYMIDVVTHYTRAIFIKSKKKEVIVDMIIQLWTSIFGAANMFLMDNGGEFANDEMRELGNQFGISIKHTALHMFHGQME